MNPSVICKCEALCTLEDLQALVNLIGIIDVILRFQKLLGYIHAASRPPNYTQAVAHRSREQGAQLLVSLQCVSKVRILP